MPDLPNLLEWGGNTKRNSFTTNSPVSPGGSVSLSNTFSSSKIIQNFWFSTRCAAFAYANAVGLASAHVLPTCFQPGLETTEQFSRDFKNHRQTAQNEATQLPSMHQVCYILLTDTTDGFDPLDAFDSGGQCIYHVPDLVLRKHHHVRSPRGFPSDQYGLLHCDASTLKLFFFLPLDAPHRAIETHRTLAQCGLLVKHHLPYGRGVTQHF